MDDKQIAKDVKKSIDDLTNGNTKGKSFGAFVVKAEQDRIAKLSKMKSEAGRKGGLASAAARQKLLDIANKKPTAEKTTNDQVSIDATTPTPISTDETRESRPAAERGKGSRAISLPSDAAAGSHVEKTAGHAQKFPARSFGEFGVVHLTDAQADRLRAYYGTDFDRAVGILENYIMGLPSRADGDEKGCAKYWREDYSSRNHYYTMRKDNWVDNALKKAKAEDKRLETAGGFKSFQEKDRDDRSNWLSRSMFGAQEAI